MVVVVVTIFAPHPPRLGFVYWHIYNTNKQLSVRLFLIRDAKSHGRVRVPFRNRHHHHHDSLRPPPPVAAAAAAAAAAVVCSRRQTRACYRASLETPS